MAFDADRVMIWVPGAPGPVPYTTGRRGVLPPYLPGKGDTVRWDGHRYEVQQIEWIFHEDRLMLIFVHLAEEEEDPRPGPRLGSRRSATDLATARKIA